MELLIVSFGKLKNPGFRESANHYLKLLSGFCKVRELELRATQVPDKSPATRTRIQEEEGTLLLEKLGKELGSRGKFYLLDETGKALKTQEWAKLLEDAESKSLSPLAFCVGGSLGFSQAVRSQAQGLLSLGPQTLAHELARIVILEQLFRARSLLAGHPYHHEGS